MPQNPATSDKSSVPSSPHERNTTGLRRGRKKGTPNKANAERRRRAEATGLLPAEMLLEISRSAFAEFKALEAKKPRKADEIVAHRAELLVLRTSAGQAAAAAAPYYNPKLATTEWTGPNGGPIQTRSVVVNVDPDKHKGLLKDILG